MAKTNLIHKCLIFFITALVLSAQSTASRAEANFVSLPKIKNNTVAPRIIYIENPRFQAISPLDLQKVVQTARGLVNEHFGIAVKLPGKITTLKIDAIFPELIKNKPQQFDNLIGDFRNNKVDWTSIKELLIEQIKKQKDPLAKQIEFARPYLVTPLAKEEPGAFAQAVMTTMKERLLYWTEAKLDDGLPVIGAQPYNEYGYWTLMAKLGIEAEIVLTNQLVASVEYMPTPVHTSIRGGITGGATEYNPKSKYGASVWVSLFPYFSEDPQIKKLRNGDSYSRDEALTYAGIMLAHEMGHQLLQLGHPWSNKACLMRPAEVLDFSAWAKNLDAEKCRIDSSPAMKPGTAKAPIW
ncbi:MAG: hypothetical protein OQJ97_10735 [Rhodospirillales bacterium]|nr:hypothetical protein [Rhodospirillales bacterium]